MLISNFKHPDHNPDPMPNLNLVAIGDLSNKHSNIWHKLLIYPALAIAHSIQSLTQSLSAISNRWLMTAITLMIAISLSLGLAIAPAVAALPTKSAIKDARIILRNALPIENEFLRDIQRTLEQMPRQVNLKRWSSLKKDIDSITKNLAQNQTSIINAAISDRQDLITAHLTSLTNALVPLQEAIEAKDRYSIKALSEKALDYVGLVEAELIDKFPYEVPAKYAQLPQLKGRALVELVTNKGNVIITVDGYSAPINAGQFIDLVQKGFYDGLTFTRADENYYLQTGDPEGAADGYIDPQTGKERTVPIEVRLPDQKVPLYGKTFEEMGLTGTLPVLPFAAFGTVAMAHPADANAGSSQFFIYLFESDLTPAGLNLLDGNYTVFGYVTDGKETLDKLRLGDQVLSARVISGAENLVNATTP